MSMTSHTSRSSLQPSRLHQAIQHILLASALTVSAAAQAETSTDTASIRHNYHISGGSLGQALRQFATNSGLLYSAEAELTEGKTTAGLDGEYTAEDALKKLLVGTGLTYTFTAEGAVAVKVAETGSNAESTLPTVKVIGDALTNENDPFNKDYNKSNATTATKTNKSLMETPHSIQVIPRQVIEDRKITTIEEFTDNVSGVQRLNWENGMSQYIIRGFFESRDRLYNGFREFNNSGPTDVSNIERVEILKGPSAMLYGGGLSNSGVVNMVTKKPLDYTYNHADFTAGSYDFYRARIDSAGALTDDKSLQYRLNLSYKNANSFRDFISDENYFIAPNLLWKISDKDTVDFRFEYNKFNYAYDPGFFVDNFNSVYKNLPISRNLSEPNQFNEGSTYRTSYDYQHQFNDDWKFRQGFMTSMK
jgi:iron complex outermembrane receptor protein